MLGLPKNTELSKLLPKKAIYAKFHMNTAEKEKIDKDISRITIVNEVSPSKVNIAEGEEVKSFFVMSVVLKRKDYNEKNIITLSKLIPQNMIMILQHDNTARLAVYHTKLLQTEWKPLSDFSIELNGLDFDKVWENIIVQLGDIRIDAGKTLDEQIEIDDRKEKLKKEIEKLERKARSENQPKKKFELFKQINNLKDRLNGKE